MAIDESLLEIREYTGVGYRPLVDFGAWRVAVLRYIDELLPHNIRAMQRHDETDEVFVLLQGRCILFLGEGGEAGVRKIHAQDLRQQVLYNVKRLAWHTHTLSADAVVLVIENRDTGDANSPVVPLTAAQRAELVKFTHELWSVRDF